MNWKRTVRVWKGGLQAPNELENPEHYDKISSAHLPNVSKFQYRKCYIQIAFDLNLV